jgi:deoxyadenosine/deoxycytidine kinase
MYYTLEGNVGAGKSTLLALLTQYIPHLTVIYEPVAQWQRQVNGHSLLANFYQDPYRWAYVMETATLLSRVQLHSTQPEQEGQYSIMERSVYSGYYCFAQNDYDNGFLIPLEWEIYKSWFNFIVPLLCQPPNGFIYLRVSPLKALERIKNRGRAAEAKITLSYLEQLDQLHDRFLIEKKGVLPQLKDVPVLIIPGDGDFEHDIAYRMNIIESVSTFLATGKVY